MNIAQILTRFSSDSARRKILQTSSRVVFVIFVVTFFLRRKKMRKEFFSSLSKSKRRELFMCKSKCYETGGDVILCVYTELIEACSCVTTSICLQLDVCDVREGG